MGRFNTGDHNGFGRIQGIPELRTDPSSQRYPQQDIWPGTVDLLYETKGKLRQGLFFFRNRVGDVYRIIAWRQLQMFEESIIGSLSGKEIHQGIFIKEIHSF